MESTKKSEVKLPGRESTIASGGQSRDLKSGFSFLSHIAKTDGRRKQTDDESEEDPQ
jgi:hypothetical protein